MCSCTLQVPVCWHSPLEAQPPEQQAYKNCNSRKELAWCYICEELHIELLVWFKLWDFWASFWMLLWQSVTLDQGLVCSWHGSLGMVVGQRQLCYCTVGLHLLHTVPDLIEELILFNQILKKQFLKEEAHTPIRQLWDGRSGLLSS